MKNLILVIVSLIFLASCEKDHTPEIIDTTTDDIMYDYDSVFIETDYPDAFNTITEASIHNFDPSASPYTVIISKMYTSSGAGNATEVRFDIPNEGAFDVAFTHYNMIGSSTDSLYITGYFDADTMYMQYYFERIGEPTANGNVSLHSF